VSGAAAVELHPAGGVLLDLEGIRGITCGGGHTVDAQLLLSRLADASARRSAAWWLLALCGLGSVASVLALAAMGFSLDRWIFVLLVWAVLIFVPALILMQAAPSLTSGLRRRTVARIVAHPQRYEIPAYLQVVVEELAARALTLPRICHPVHRRQAAEAAAAILTRAAGRPDVPVAQREAIGVLVAATAKATTALSSAATGEAAETIQARWEGARALGALAALTATLEAAYADRWSRPPDLPELGGGSLGEYLGSVLDYCDEAALQVDALPWMGSDVASPVPDAALEDVALRWREYISAGLPAPRALEAFVASVLPARAP
jgi:hypothetical protein